jgi:predicted nucleotidyltransferase
MTDMLKLDPRLEGVIAAQPYPFLFASISGAHLYGFPSPDSDYDLRGVHILPVSEVIGLNVERETIEQSEIIAGLEIDLVTHDVKKFCGLMLKKNGYMLEQLYSPLIVRTSPEHEALKAIARDCITRHHSHHYIGFSENQWRLLQKESPHRVKPLLYVYRVLLTGIHLMRSGEIETNLLQLNTIFKLPYIPDLVARKLGGAERSTLDDADMHFHEAEFKRLRAELDTAFESSHLPEEPRAYAALNDFLIGVRLNAPT